MSELKIKCFSCIAGESGAKRKRVGYGAVLLALVTILSLLSGCANGETAQNAGDESMSANTQETAVEMQEPIQEGEENMNEVNFGLVYDGAITENAPGQVNIHPVTYDLNGVKIAANVYTPADYEADSGKTYPAVTVAHPNGGVKEQVAGLFAQKLAENGYIAIAADAAYQGGSEGTPHETDHPAQRIEDVSGMVDFLQAFPGADPKRIGAFGVCGGGGYTLGAAQIDKRIKAVATLSMFNSGRVRRNGFQDSQLDSVQQRLEEAAAARTREKAGEEIPMSGGMPGMTEEQVAQLPFDLYRDGYYYYVADYAHPLATGRYTTSSLMQLMAWDVEDRMDLIRQPLLMMAGSEADTLYMTEDAFAKATGASDKELFLIEGATHIRTYFVPEYVRQATEKLAAFFERTL